MLTYFTSNKIFIEKLPEFASPEGQDDLWYYLRPSRTILLKYYLISNPFLPPLDYLLDLLSFLFTTFSLRTYPETMKLCMLYRGIYAYVT